MNERCNGLDDDCNGIVDDDAICGRYVEDHCRLWLGWADGYAVTNRLVTDEPIVATWGDCPDDDEDDDGVEVCVGTENNREFRRLRLPDVNNYRANFDDEAGLAFACEDNQNSALAAWIQTHCTVYIGHTVTGEQVGTRPDWGACPEGVPDEAWKCTGNGPDGQFRMMGFSGSLRLGEGDVLGIAFRCHDPREALLAASLTQSVEVLLAWADHHGRGFPDDGDEQWLMDIDGCPPESSREHPERRCVSSNGDGLFHPLYLGGTIDANRGSEDVFGLSLRARNQGLNRR